MAIFISPGGGGGTPGGDNTQIQFNDGGTFGADTEAPTYNKTTNLLTTKGDISLDDAVGGATMTLQVVTPVDATFTASISTTTMTLTSAATGTFAIGQVVSGTGVTAGTTIVSLTGGSLGANSSTYLVSISQTVSPAVAMQSGTNKVISLPNRTGTVALVAGSTTAVGYTALDGGFYGALPYSNGRALEFSNALGFNPANGTLSTRALSSLTLAMAGALSGATTIAMSSTLTGGTTATFSTGYNIGTSVELRADAVNIFSQLRTTSAQAYRLYNTFTSATDNELGKLAWERSTSDASTNGFITGTALTVDSGTGIAAGQIVTGTGVTPGTRIISGSGTSWVVSQSQTVGTTGARVAMVFGAPALRVGTEKGSGGGTARPVEVQTDSITRLAFDTTGSVRVVTALTVATLPATPSVGMIARVTDATTPAVGSTVTGGGAAAALVWYNGSTWSVIGV